MPHRCGLAFEYVGTDTSATIGMINSAATTIRTHIGRGAGRVFDNWASESLTYGAAHSWIRRIDLRPRSAPIGDTARIDHSRVSWLASARRRGQCVLG